MLASLKDSLNIMEHYIMYMYYDVGWWISSHSHSFYTFAHRDIIINISINIIHV